MAASADVRVLAGVLLSVCTVAIGCDFNRPVPADPTTTTSSNLSPLEQAREVMGYFDLPLPAHAQQIRVVKPPLERFRAKALVSFTAPRQQVIDQTCENVEYKSFDSPPLMSGFDDEILGYANVKIDRQAYGSCSQYLRGRKIDVLIPRTEGGTTYIVLYHVPYH